MWRDNKRHGPGLYFSSESNCRYEGNFNNGIFHGEGTMYYSNGNVYSGLWKLDLKDGFGKMIYSNGEVFQGI